MSNDYSEDDEEDYGDIIAEVYSEFEHIYYRKKEDVIEAANEYEEALLARGVPKDIVEDQKEAFLGEVLSQEEYNEFYGLD